MSVLRDPHDLEQGHERGIPRRHVLVAEVINALPAINPAGVPALEPIGVDGEPAGGAVTVGSVVAVHERVGDHLPYGVLRVLGNVSSPALLDDDLRPRIPTDERHRVLDNLVDVSLQALGVKEAGPILGLRDLGSRHSHSRHAQVGIYLLGIIAEAHEAGQRRDAPRSAPVSDRTSLTSLCDNLGRPSFASLTKALTRSSSIIS